MWWTPTEISACRALSPVALGVCGRTVSSWGPSPSRTSWCCRRLEDIRPAAPCGDPDPHAPSPRSPTATNTSRQHQTRWRWQQTRCLQWETHHFRIRLSAVWEDLPQKDSVTPYVWLSGEFLQEQTRQVEFELIQVMIISHLMMFLTLFFKASGAVHLTGNFELSVAVELIWARPKSLILATVSSDTRMLRPARSRCRSFFDSRCSIPSQTSLRTTQKWLIHVDYDFKCSKNLWFLRGPHDTTKYTNK